ncbi:MAG: ACP S-malonyltransferase [Candidatus Eisenbacteria bacterium]|nr:ACP S-malonyltransferase [Candidatus Eisenbacteria bacterium]
MGRALAEAFPEARAVYDEADATLGFPLSRLCWEGPEAELRQTVNTQPALLTHSVAALRLVEKAGIAPQWTAGHSLGEYSACVAAGALEFRDALPLVRRRGQLMDEAGRERPGTMAALLGVEAEAARLICDRARDLGVVVPANFNAPGQVVISGERKAVEGACRFAEAFGAKRVVMLEVSGAFHSPLMESASKALAVELDRAAIHDARCPVIANATAEPAQRAADIRAALKRQVLGAVLWEDSMRRLLELGAEGFVEIGTGRVLRGLLRSIARGAGSWNIEDPQTLGTALGELGVQRLPARSA